MKGCPGLNRIKVLVMSLSDPSRDPRPNRIIGLCKKLDMQVSILGCFTDLVPENCYNVYPYNKNICVRMCKRLLRYLAYIAPVKPLDQFFYETAVGLREARKKIDGRNFDLLIVEDLFLLQFAHEIKQNGKILFDAREYYPRQQDGEFLFELIEKGHRIKTCNKYLRQCNAIITVSEGLAKEYKREFSVNAQVILSAPMYKSMKISPTDENRIHMIYHGAAGRNRQLEKLITIFKKLDARFTLDMILVGNEKYKNELIALAEDDKKISFPSPVSLNEIVPMLNRNYDIALLYFEPVTFNLANCLPNKLFECIHAGLAIAAGPTPDIAKIVNEHECGFISPEFSVDAMVNLLSQLTKEQMDEAKRKSLEAARILCFEEESKKIEEIIQSILKNN